MPRLWTQTVESHKEEVRGAILDAAGQLVLTRGLLAVTMSQLAEASGIGRATLYKYFGDVEEVVTAWHDRQVAAHLSELRAVRDRPGPPATRLRSVLEAYARVCRQRGQHDGDGLGAVLHRGDRVDRTERQLQELVTGLVNEAAAAGAVRTDAPAAELAGYCIHALGAAGHCRTAAAVARLVDVVWAGLVAEQEQSAP